VRFRERFETSLGDANSHTYMFHDADMHQRITAELAESYKKAFYLKKF
jgi:hypothetical protein